VSETSEYPKGYRFPRTIISYAVYLYHRFVLSYRDVQELLFERGIDVSRETVRAWCARFGPDIAHALRHRKPRRSWNWHLDEMRVVIKGNGSLAVAGSQRARRGIGRAAAKAPGYGCGEALFPQAD
jgi:transposase-like protein